MEVQDELVSVIARCLNAASGVADIQKFCIELNKYYIRHDIQAFAELCESNGICDPSILWLQFKKLKGQRRDKDENLIYQSRNQQFNSEKLEFKSEKVVAVNQVELDENLPIGAREGEIAHFLKNSARICYIEAETGAGKSTLLPFLIHKYFGVNVIVTEPRRIAAIALAQRTHGGYIVRFERRFQGFSPRCQAVYVTDGAFLPNVLSFSGAWVIIDEAHERTVYTDLVLAYLSLDTSFPKIIVTSAARTALNSCFKVSEASKTNFLVVPGRSFNVRRIYQTRKQAYKPFVEETIEKLFTDLLVPSQLRSDFCAFLQRSGVLLNESLEWGMWDASAPFGTILAFLPGAEDIKDACARLTEFLRIVTRFLRTKAHEVPETPQVHALYGEMPLCQQKAAFQAAERSVCAIIATNVAETSLTVPNVVFVVDSAREKQFWYDADRHCERLSIELISCESETERAGRAGRVRDGVYISCLTAQEHALLKEAAPAEITRKRLDNVIFQVIRILARGLAQGTLRGHVTRDSIYAFPFPQSPSKSAVHDALHTLMRVGYISESKGQIDVTMLGTEAAKMSLDPELSYFLILAFSVSPQRGEEAADVAAFLAAGNRLTAFEDDGMLDDFQRILGTSVNAQTQQIRTQVLKETREACEAIDCKALLPHSYVIERKPSLEALFAIATENIAFRTKNGFRRPGDSEVLKCSSGAHAVCFNSIMRDDEHAWLSVVGALTIEDLDVLQKPAPSELNPP